MSLLKRQIRFLSVVLTLLMLAAACGSDDDSTGDSADAIPNEDVGESPNSNGDETCTPERVGGSIKLSNYQELKTLDPYLNGASTLESNGAIMVALYDTLVRFDPEAGEFTGYLAESVEPNDDFSEWRATLHDGIKFGNGDTLDAAAVQASVERHLDPDGSSRLKAVSEIIADVRAEGDDVVVFELAEPWAGFPSLLADGIGMVQNVDLIEERGEKAFASDASGGGVGPYEVSAFNPPEEVLLTAKDDYWNGPVCIEEISLTFIADSDTAYDSFTRGETDAMVLGRDPAKLAEARDQADADGFEIYSQLQIGGSIVLINVAEGSPTEDVRVRQAVAAAIDPSVINDRAFAGSALATKDLIPDEAQLFTPTEGRPVDPDEAAALVEEVKADTGWDGSIRLDAGNAPQANVESAIAIGAMLDAVGFDTTIDTTLTVTDIRTKMRDKNFDLGLWGISAGEENLWLRTNQYSTGNSANIGSFSEPEMDQALADLRLASSDAEKDEAVTEMQSALNETVPFVPYVAFEQALLWNENISGMRFGANMVIFFEQAYLAR